jgi:multiple sugar transport system substrate-binding protein
MLPNHSQNVDDAKAFMLHLVNNYSQATFNSELYNFPAWDSTVPNLSADAGWLDQDPFRSRPIDKLAVLKTARDWTVNIGYPGPANPAEGEVQATFIIPEMMARCARGEVTAAEAVAEAEARIVPIFERWREQGLVGGGE